jgi:serine/threonine protein kinase
VRHRQTGEVFAVKRSRQRFRSKIQRERCLREIRAVSALPAHPNIVSQYRAWQEGGQFYIQMDYCEGGSLQQLIQQVSGGIFGMQVVTSVSLTSPCSGCRLASIWCLLHTASPPPSGPGE